MENRLTPEDAMQFIEQMYPMAILDQDGHYTYVNQSWIAAVKRRGVPLNGPDDVLGKYVADIIPDSKAPYVLKYGVPLLGEYIENSGTFTSYIPRRDASGVLNGCFIYVIIPEMVQAKALGRKIDTLTREIEYYKKELSDARGARYDLDQIIGKSAQVTHLKAQILQAAGSSSTVLIEGETGTGKELVAHALHAHSPRRAQNFVRINCSAIPPELMESEFFGYSPGSFTGASKKGKLGRFLLANKGSLFLDEVNLLPKTIQPKFLRVLQEHEIDPVGSEKSVPVDFRLIAASNIPLESLVEQKLFRQDLYFRLNVIRITIPPLRERREDIPLLVNALIDRLNAQLGMLVHGVEPSVLRIFEDYDWPGNIRELQNVLESAMNMSSSSVLMEKDFDRLLARISGRKRRGLLNGQPGNQLRQSKDSLERELLTDTLQACGGNRRRTAQLLGISRSVLYRKLKKYHIDS